MASPSAAASPLAALADELGELERFLAPHKSKIARADALRKLLREAYRDEQADKCFTVTGSKFLVELGPKGNESSVDKSKLFDLVGVSVALNLCSVPLKALDSFASDVRAAVISQSQTGSRPIKVYPAPVAMSPAAAPKEKPKRATRAK